LVPLRAESDLAALAGGDDKGVHFRYTTSGGNMPVKSNLTAKQMHQLADWMSKKKLVIEVWNSNFMRDEHIGTCEIDLLTLCSGPSDFTLLIRNPAAGMSPSGHLHMELTMTQISEVRIHVSHIKVQSLPYDTMNNMPPRGPYKVKVASNLHRQFTTKESSLSIMDCTPFEVEDAMMFSIDASMLELVESTLNVAVYTADDARYAACQVQAEATR